MEGRNQHDNVQHPFSKQLVMYCSGYAEVKGNNRVGRLAGEAIIANSLRPGIAEVLREVSEATCRGKA